MIELPPELEFELEALAQRTGQSEVEIIVEALEYHLQSERGVSSRLIGIIQDEEVQAAHLDDWLKANWRPEDDWR